MFLYSKWLGLPLPTRHEIAKSFGISKKKPTHVANNIVVEDGFDLKDIEGAITLVSLKDFTKSNNDNIEVLWDKMVDKINGVEVVPPVEVAPVIATATPVVTEPQVIKTKRNVKTK